MFAHASQHRGSLGIGPAYDVAGGSLDLDSWVWRADQPRPRVGFRVMISFRVRVDSRGGVYGPADLAHTCTCISKAGTPNFSAMALVSASSAMTIAFATPHRLTPSIHVSSMPPSLA